MVNVEKNNTWFRQLLFLGILIALGLVIFKQLAFFVGAFLGAITLYVVLRPLLFHLVEKRHWRSWIASLTLVSLMSIVMLALGYVVFEVIAGELPGIDTSRIVQGLDQWPDKINKMLGYQLITGNLVSQVAGYMTGFFSSILNTTYSFAANIFMMMILLYFVLANARRMEEVIFAYMPFSGRSLLMIEDEFQNMIYSNAVGIPVVLICQSIVAGLIYWALGLNNVVFWAFLTALCGLIPMLGTVLVTLPLGIYLISGGEIWQGIVLIASGILIIANVDNVCRIVMMKKFANTHPLIVIFGVILGMPLFGFWGIIFGPLFISGFLLLIKIYYIEYRLISPAKMDELDGNDEEQEEVGLKTK